MIPYEYLQFLQEKIREHLPPTFSMTGGRYNGRCPFCGDSAKSITKKRGWIYFSKDCSYYCFNCGVGMSGMKFLEAISGQSYDDIKKQYLRLLLNNKFSNTLSSEFEIPTEEPGIFQLTSCVNKEWKNPLSAKAVEYLTHRKVLEAPFYHHDLYTTYGRNQEEYILIPWKINDIEAYYQLNDFQKLHSLKYIFPKSKKKLVYGLDDIDVSFPYIFLFEGVYDSLFVKNGVALGTKSFTTYQLNLIKDRYPHHQLVVSFDNDKAGISSMMKVIQSDGQFKYLKWFNKNTHEKDINDYVLSKGKVNMFADKNMLKHLIVDKLSMKMFLIQNGLWATSEKKTFYYRQPQHDNSTFWKKRKIQFS